MSTSTQSIRNITSAIKKDSFQMAALTKESRNEALKAISEKLWENRLKIQIANELDLKNAEKNQIPAPILKRLKFDEQKLQDVLSGIDSLISLSDPLFQTLLERELDENLTLQKITCPIGVIGVIFESRPDALVQIAALCLKSGNCAILKGGSEAAHTNRILFELIHEAGVASNIPNGFLTLIENRAEIQDLLKCNESIDLLIPRGSNSFVQYIMENTKIPVMGHADGVCHIFVDQDADFEKALPIILDAKTQYVVACNTVETLLIHESIAKEFLPQLQNMLEKNKVSLIGCEKTRAMLSLKNNADPNFRTEYSDYVISVKIVSGLDAAIAHINYYGSHHTDCILTEDSKTAERFMLLVDSAGVYQNCSTRFADGFRYGFGAEVGISTGKLHARGPVGLDGLVTYKYKLFGNGQIVSDYAQGQKSFHFKDIASKKC
ncbi:glutamate-5-semialdehyde dehydrogenase [Sinanaerobacter sp. ZZT-01]|uniref:glutamate-5-semialdehyde dehydrogenase n=1 Tax=Sinanaerobacter sp. ZZT-01 TaxID=3111540 RepID=UPI002D76F174|nr:glutamate-5-semialdehyde dehydrogenase [Sinanaerobacter sp. ZZT-01]WRR92494.1 glutamate-5-semialdehyde dehydrogenase [Sinanaerobacter sp. ZZT-01]